MRLALRKTDLDTRDVPASPVGGHTEIAIEPHAGSIVVRDPRVFQPGQRTFALRLLEVAVREADVLRARVDLAAATCRVDFRPRARTSHEMAECFAAAVRRALAPEGERPDTPSLRPSGNASTLTAYPTDGYASVWESATPGRGRVWLHHRALADGYAERARLANAARDLAGVRRCTAGRWDPVLLIDLDPDVPALDRLIDDVEHLRKSLGSTAADRAGPPAARRTVAPPAVVSGVHRAFNALLAGTCLVLTGVALLIPGMPTLPFLLATSYYLARSSPRFDGLLHRTAIIGPVLTEWETDHGLSAGSKHRLVGLMTVIFLATLVLLPVSVVGLALMLAVFALSVRSVVRMPGFPPAGSKDERLPAPARPALVGPVA